MSPVQQIHGSDILDGTVRNIDLHADTTRTNLITNGGFEIWQRGAGPFTASGARTADLWQCNMGGTSTYSTSRNAANADGGVGYCAAVTYTHQTGSGMLQYSNDLLATLRGRTVSLSARVRTSTPNAVRLTIACVGGTGSAWGAFHSGSGAYETLTLTTTVGTATTTLAFGFDFLATCTVYLDNVMLVVGAVPAAYAPLHPVDDLMRCLRYYEVIGGTGVNDLIISSIATAASQSVYEAFQYRVIKPMTPTVTLGTWDGGNQSGASFNTGSAWSVRLGCISAGAGSFFCSNGTAGSGIIAEANP